MSGTVTISVERYDELKSLYDSFHNGDVITYRGGRMGVISKDEYVNEITEKNIELKEAIEEDSYYYRLTALQDLFRYENFTFFNAFFIIRKIKKILYP